MGKFEGKIKGKAINIGCGEEYLEGFVNQDIQDTDIYGRKIKVDVVFDLEKRPYPFPDNHFDFVLAKGIIEHLNDVNGCLHELHRICKPGAIIEIHVPHYTFYGYFRDPSHKTAWSYDSIEFYCGWLASDRKLAAKYNIKKKWLKYSYTKPLEWIFAPLINLAPMLYERFWCWMVPCQEVVINLEVKK